MGRKNIFKKFLFLTASFGICFGSLAQQPTRNDLKKLEERIKQQEQTQAETKQKADELSNELKAVQQQIVQSAKKVQEQEAQLSKLDVQYHDLEQEKEQIRKDLSLTDGQLVQLVTGLQTLSLRPKEAMFLQIKEPIQLLRSGLLLKGSVPVVGSVSDSLKNDLQRLSDTEKKLANKIKEKKEATEKLSQTHPQINK